VTTTSIMVGLYAAAAGDLKRAQAIAPLEGVAAATAHSRDLTKSHKCMIFRPFPSITAQHLRKILNSAKTPAISII
jgi:hypothetical protein